MTKEQNQNNVLCTVCYTRCNLFSLPRLSRGITQGIVGWNGHPRRRPCIWVCVWVCLCMNVHFYVWVCEWECVWVCVCVYVSAWMWMCGWVRAYVHLCECICVGMSVWVCVSVRMFVSICTNACVYGAWATVMYGRCTLKAILLTWVEESWIFPGFKETTYLKIYGAPTANQAF